MMRSRVLPASVGLRLARYCVDIIKYEQVILEPCVRVLLVCTLAYRV